MRKDKGILCLQLKCNIMCVGFFFPSKFTLCKINKFHKNDLKTDSVFCSDGHVPQLVMVKLIQPGSADTRSICLAL